MEKIKTFFISIFTCTPVKTIRERRYRKFQLKHSKPIYPPTEQSHIYYHSEYWDEDRYHSEVFLDDD